MFPPTNIIPMIKILKNDGIFLDIIVLVIFYVLNHIWDMNNTNHIINPHLIKRNNKYRVWKNNDSKFSEFTNSDVADGV